MVDKENENMTNKNFNMSFYNSNNELITFFCYAALRIRADISRMIVM